MLYDDAIELQTRGNAHVVGMEQLVSIAGVGEARESDHRLVKHGQIRALMNLQNACLVRMNEVGSE